MGWGSLLEGEIKTLYFVLCIPHTGHAWNCIPLYCRGNAGEGAPQMPSFYISSYTHPSVLQSVLISHILTLAACARTELGP